MNPEHPRKAPPKKLTLGRVPKTVADDEFEIPRASILSTMVLLAGLFATMTTVSGTTSSSIAAYMAWGIGLSLGLSVLIDLHRGIRNLVRTDVMALFSLFFLTLFEFLTPQTRFDQVLAPPSVMAGGMACAWGFAGMAIGRHFIMSGKGHFASLFERPVTPAFIVKLYWFCMVAGYFYIFYSVNFNPIEVVSQFMDARFSQAWSRGKLGDWRAILGELGLLIYVIPAIAGVVMAKREAYTKSQLVQVICGFGFTLFYGFAGGTRNVFASYLVTFLIGFAFSLPRRKTMQLIVVSCVTALILLLAARAMLEFRTVGLKYYLSGEMKGIMGDSENEFFIDYNLLVICELTQIFPERHPFLGWEIPYLAAIRPIPRTLWPGKPEGLSLSIEDALGAEGLTLASSFVGEAYVSFGNTGVFTIGLFFGVIFAWWSLLASPRNSDFGVLVYASGFFAAVISMRSLFVFTTAVLPTVGAIVVGQFFLQQKQHVTPRLGRTKKQGPDS